MAKRDTGAGASACARSDAKKRCGAALPCMLQHVQQLLAMLKLLLNSLLASLSVAVTLQQTRRSAVGIEQH